MSVKSYFLERCVGGQKSTDFWPTIKPFLSKKCKSGDNTIVLNENNTVLSDPKDICDTFNHFYVNVANDIGKDVVFDKENHSSLNAIKLNAPVPYKKRLLLRCLHHFKSDSNNNMDHMRISGTEPSSVVLSQRSNFKS